MIKQAIKWLVYSNVWVSLNVMSLVYYGTVVGVLEFHPIYLILSFFATLFAYNVQRLMKLGMDNPKKSERHIWIDHNAVTIKVLTVLAFVFCLIGVILLYDPVMIYIGIPALILVLLYAGGWKQGLRAIPLLKIFLISSVWLVVVALLPKMLFHEILILSDWYYFLAIWLFIFVLCLPFDIRDLDSDKGIVKTIPSIIGVKGTKWFASALLSIPIYFGMVNHFFGIVIVSLFSIPVIILTSKDHKELFFTGLIDGLFCLLTFLEILFDLLKS